MTTTYARPVAGYRVGLLLQRKLVLYADRIQRGRESHPLAGVTAEVAGAGSRYSARYLTVSGPDFAWSYHVDKTTEHRARRFAARVNAMAQQYGQT